MAVNSPGSSYNKQMSSKPTTPRSPRHFMFPKCPSPKSPLPRKEHPEGAPEIRSPKSPMRFDFDRTGLTKDVYADFFSDPAPNSPQSVLKPNPNKKSPNTHITNNPGYQMMCYSSSNSTSVKTDQSCSYKQVESTKRSKVNSPASSQSQSNSKKEPSRSHNNSSADLTSDTHPVTTESSLRRSRKSTSDLTDLISSDVPPQSAPRRRGSSKGGLAYLASRRGSRESVKSQASNVSIFSNEEVGPLAFQKSERGRQRRTSNFLELPVPDHARPRVCSLPERPYNPRVSDDLYRLRTFSITSKGSVVNCGDSIISRRSRSNTSVNSTASRASDRSPFDTCCGAGYLTVGSLSQSSSQPSSPMEPPNPKYRVVMLGEAGVGKTALVSQFMTSEYMNTYDASLDDEFGEKTVSVLLDGEESEMVFIDHPSVEMSLPRGQSERDEEWDNTLVQARREPTYPELYISDVPGPNKVENSLSTYEPHACIVVYSVVARNSFRFAEDTLNYLWREKMTSDKAVIVVGNKADLARARVISTSEGKALAASRDCKFIETSSGIQHNVDELLVGVLKQVRLKETRDKKKMTKVTSKLHNSKTHMSLHIAREILQKMCINDISKSKSCENLHVL